MAAPPPAADPAVLMDELVEECLLRVPPEDPADLARAALVSKQWHRVVTGVVFRRRYIEFHRSEPLLGYIDNLDDSIRFVSMSSSFRPRIAHRHCVQALHSSHGRILLCSIAELKREDSFYLFVWDPITDKEWELPVLSSTPAPDICNISNFAIALVCAVGDGCSHVDCHFEVVVVGVSGGQAAGRAFSCFYSSKSDSWSDRIFVSGQGGYFSMRGVLVGSALYFTREICHGGLTIAKYDLTTHQMSMISLQLQCEVAPVDYLLTAIATEDGRLGVTMINDSTLHLWLREQGRLVESRVIQLRALLPDDALHDLLPPEALVDKPQVAAFADTRAGGVIFLWTCVGYFTIDLNSWRTKKVGESLGSVFDIVPYLGFCTPAPGIVSTDVGPGASVVVSTDDESGAGVAVSRDEGPGDVAVSIDEGPGDVAVSIDEGPGNAVGSTE